VNSIPKLYMSVAGGIMVMLFGAWTPLFGVYMVLWAIDVITGMIASGKEGKLSSIRGALGIGKKVIIICLIASAHMADIVLGTGDIIRDSTLFWFVVNEFISIAENCGRAGVPLPPKLEQAIEIIRPKNNKDKE
jgi:toxin secretion/phage lysis holin